MKLIVIGTGYVGLVTGTCFAEMGNDVTCVDTDVAKISRLKAGEIPIYEPGLNSIVATNFKSGRLRFADSLPEITDTPAIYFIAVGTPPGENGSADLQYVLAAARTIGRKLSAYSVIVNKSTVPVGTAERVRAAIQEQLVARNVDIAFDVVSNPEFLKEGTAVEDFMRPDRIIVGSDSERARSILRELYAPFTINRDRTLFMGTREAEITKYASNAMLATRISFMNEIAALCDRLGVDVESVRQGLGADSRIGYAFIYPGCGYGGSCFPKDVTALIRTAAEAGVEATLLQAVSARNDRQKKLLAEKICARFGANLSGKTFALWGLAFKPGTDDLREAPSQVLINALISAGAQVQAHDPVAMPNARRELPQAWFEQRRLTLVDDPYAALAGAEALVLVTEWKPYRHPDFARIQKLLKQPVIFDGRNQYDPVQLKRLGFDYQGIGRK